MLCALETRPQPWIWCDRGNRWSDHGGGGANTSVSCLAPGTSSLALKKCWFRRAACIIMYTTPHFSTPLERLLQSSLQQPRPSNPSAVDVRGNSRRQHSMCCDSLRLSFTLSAQHIHTRTVTKGAGPLQSAGPRGSAHRRLHRRPASAAGKQISQSKPPSATTACLHDHNLYRSSAIYSTFALPFCIHMHVRTMLAQLPRSKASTTAEASGCRSLA